MMQRTFLIGLFAMAFLGAVSTRAPKFALADDEQNAEVAETNAEQAAQEANAESTNEHPNEDAQELQSEVIDGESDNELAGCPTLPDCGT
jgi:hypothetical protein